ncbi:MAG: hypothetical protein H0W75_08905 [Chitinophagaceae bacterium]|nr:hypothetical protein [Chitinophagaceae bacterium]
MSILVVGVGKFGSNLAKNIRDYLPEARLTLCNRTAETGTAWSQKLNASCIEFNKLTKSFNQFDVIVTTVGVEEKYLIDTDIPIDQNKKLIIDLSIPQGVNPLLGEHGHIQLLSMDDIAKQVSESMEVRQAEIPNAEEIINKYLAEFYQWSKLYDRRFEIKEIETLLGYFTEKCLFLFKTDVGEKIKLKKTILSDYIISMRKVLQKNASPHFPDEILINYRKMSIKYDFISHCGLLDKENGTCNKCKEQLN